MGDMADFIGYNCPDYYEDSSEIKLRAYNIENLMVYKDETIYNECKQLGDIDANYEFKDLCESILAYYEKHRKLSEKQRFSLCCLLDYYGFVELEEKTDGN